MTALLLASCLPYATLLWAATGAPAPNASGQQHASPAAPPLLPFHDYAEGFLAERGLEAEPGSSTGLDTLLETSYVMANLGLFELWYPRYALKEGRDAREFKEAAEAVLDLQEEWLRWTTGEKSKIPNWSDLAVMKRWVRSWKLSKEASRGRGDGRVPDLLRRLSAPNSVIEASERFMGFMREGAYLGVKAAEAKGIPVILSPDRKDFLGLGSFLGTLNAVNKRILWKNALALWTQFSRDGIHVIAMKHPSTYPGRGDITQGLDMNAREKTGLSQHIVYHSMTLLMKHCYGDDLPFDLSDGLVMNMVTSLYGENNVRAGGGNRGRRTEAYTQFVAGGASSGGRLAARNADVRWRQAKGKDHFLKVLREAQRAGAAGALEIHGRGRDKRAFFALEPDGGGPDVHLVEAPFFLDRAAAGVPERFREDYLEFRRAYRCAFVHWLMNRAAPKRSKHPSDHFLRALLTRRSVPGAGSDEAGEGETPFSDRVRGIYGASFSGADGSTESLEWQFLTWLSKQR